MRRLQALYPDVSATRLKRAVTDGQVLVNGAVRDDPGAIVEESDAVSWDRNQRIRRRVETALQVLHEDDDVIAVVKPPGLLTHPTEAKEKDTLLSRVSTYVTRRHKARGYVAVVHRLDKETSGILAFALSRAGLVLLQAQLRAHSMDRRYLAVVEGAMKGESGTFDADLEADKGDAKHGAVRPRLRRGLAKSGEPGIRAITRWKVLERFGSLATLVEARLETGRTHQIRVHFSAGGHPLVGDPVYREAGRPGFPVPFARQALHAGRLGWHSKDGGAVRVEAPPPADFEKLLTELRKRTRKS